MGIPETTDLTFVIPCLDEEEEITITIESIRDSVPSGVSFEVVVADHGSSDRTVERASAAGARAFAFPDVKLGELRNCGAREARGGVLVFLDADISLTDQWGRAFPETLKRLQGGERIVTGSRTRYLHSDHWTARGFGMEPNPSGEVPYIGTAHLVVSRSLFFEMGGFRADLESGEDEDFGARAWTAGVRVVADPYLEAIHRGAPGSTWGFFLRHLWHGMGDGGSWRQWFRSKTALMGMLVVWAHSMLIPLTYPLRVIPWGLWWVWVLLIVTPPCMKWWGCREFVSRKDVAASLGAFYLYFIARGLGPLLRIRQGSGRRIWQRR